MKNGQTYPHVVGAVLAICSVLSAVSPAQTYYVSPFTGSDSNPGTNAAPWKTVSWASTHAANGSTVYLMSGNYGDVIFGAQPARSGWSQAISFEPASGATAVFTLLKFAQAGNCYLQVRGVTLNMVDRGTSTYDIAIDVFDSSYVKVQNCNVNGIWKSSVEAGMTDLGVAIRYAGKPVSNVLIEGCQIMNTQRGIDISGVVRDNIVIRNNHMGHQASTGIGLSQSNTDNGLIIIEGNHIHNQTSVAEGTSYTHGSGIAIRGNNLLIRGNIIHDCGNTRGIRSYQSVFPDTGYKNLTFENNLVYDTINDLPVELVDVGSNIAFNNNTIIGHYSISSLVRMKYDASATFLAAAQSNGSSFSFYNNVFVGYLSVDGALTGYTENNNIIWAATIDGVWKSSLKGSKTKILCSQGDCDTNLFKDSGRFFVGGSLFDQYSYTVSRDSAGNNTPHGVDLSRSYELASSAAAIGFGDAAHAPATDIRGVNRGTTVDAGCYESFSDDYDIFEYDNGDIFKYENGRIRYRN
jgi:hypothetical protein